MPFGLKNTLAIFSRIVVSAFKDFIHRFLEVYFDDWMVFGLVRDHIENLRMMLERCRQYQIALPCIGSNPILLQRLFCGSPLMQL